MNRQALITAFLDRHGYGAAVSGPLAQDASFRRYLRLIGGPRPAVLMDAPPPEDIRPFIRIAAHLSDLGLSIPAIFAADETAGLLLEEDFGDDLFPTLMPEHSQTMFDAAVDALVIMQQAPAPEGLPVWDAIAMASTARATMLDWWWPAVFGTPTPDAAQRDFAAALETMLAPIASGPTCLVHRDFFAGNMIWLLRRDGHRRVGLLDFQGAAIGHPAYDLASLLQDARRDIPAAIEERAISRYLAQRPALEPAAFRAAYDICAAQRHLRVAGQWVRLARRDHRPNYLAYGPQTWALLGAALQRPATAPLAAVLDRWIPEALRGNPPDLHP